MKRHLVITLGYKTKEGMCLLSYWKDYANPERTRFMSNGRFDEDKWEAAQTHIYMRPGVDPRAAWKEAWRMARALARYSGHLCGYTLLDCAAHIDGEALPLP